MAKCFTEWTVLPHDPIEKIGDNLWRVEGLMNEGKLQRQMVLGRMKDGRVIVHNAIALQEPQMQELEAWGEPAVMFVPNAFHRQDAAIWKKRYPKLQVVAPKGSRKRIEKIVRVDGLIEDAPGDDTVKLRPLGGSPAEGVMEVTTDGARTVVYTDAILNMRKVPGFMGWILAPTGQVACPRVARMMVVKDKRAFVADLEALIGRGVETLMFGHGKPVTSNAATELRGVVEQLR